MRACVGGGEGRVLYLMLTTSITNVRVALGAMPQAGKPLAPTMSEYVCVYVCVCAYMYVCVCDCV